MFRFKCSCCEAWQDGMPTFVADAPPYFYAIPADERDQRCLLDSDTCIIDQRHFFVRGCLEIPVLGESGPFSWGVWVSLSAGNFEIFSRCLELAKRSHNGPFLGWLSAELPLYPSTENLKARVHLRDDGIRPYIELEPTDHPLAIEQREGITAARVGEIFAHVVHGDLKQSSSRGAGVQRC